MPENYFNRKAQAILEEYEDRLHATRRRGTELPKFPEKWIRDHIDNIWHDTGEGVVGNWIGKIYQTTNMDRKIPFMADIDPNDPLGLKK
jgi:homoserine O-succinyltransferase